jgi:CBS domain-containing protein
MKLKELCELDVVCCTRELTIAAASRLMRERHVGDLVVVEELDEEREPVGIITDRDIVVEIIARDKDPRMVTVGEMMSKPIVIASESEDSTQALQRMAAHGVRRVPVVDDQRRVIGIVTLDDLLREHTEHANRLLEAVTKQQTREKRTRR